MDGRSRKRNGDGVPISEEQLRSKEVMYQAQMEIQERKRQLNMTNNRPTPVLALRPQPISSHTAKLNRAEAAVFIARQVSQREDKMKEIRERLAASSTLAALTKKAPAGLPLKKESIPIEKEVPVAAPVEEEKPVVAEKFEYKPFLDPRLKVKGAAREKRSTFNFHTKGEFETLANKQRQQARLEKLQSKIADTAQSTGISSAVRLAMVTPAIQDTAAQEIPEVEWWDEIVLGRADYDAIPSSSEPISKRYVTTITDLIEHPVQLKPPNESAQQCLKAYLTKKEMKKIRRQNRKETLKEKQEKIRLGLEKPPEPKIKMSNLMRVLGNEAIQDPTKMEEHAKKQAAERQAKHQQANQDRKLTKEEKAAKKTKKISEDTSAGVHVAVYKVKSLSHPGKKFKVEVNAKQLQMTGVIVFHNLINLVVVEGGPKQQKSYKNLMMNRIKWGDEIIGQKKDVEDRDVPGERNECHLVWEGMVQKRAFQELRSIAATSEKNAREILDKHGVAHYWDLAYSTTILNPDQEV
uniref:U4/U6 small nuclear ribonucleoprotein Prp3 n=1 Tax=Steinernema glaseri TaxID=37863 RepID=A0A1I7ZX78_9BILA